MPHAVIMAGGAGRRLWPLSRENRPKQLLPIAGGKCLLEVAVDRVRGVFEPDEILIVTGAEYSDQVAAAIPDIPAENIIGEPVGRDTANAIALAAEILAGRDPNTTMAVFTADHIIRPEQQFAASVRSAIETAEKNPNALLTFGIRPTWPHTGLGYIQCEKEIIDSVHKVLAFKEKPDHATARRYVESGKYYWNSGMFVWQVGAILDAVKEFLPQTAEKLEPVAGAVADGKDYSDILAEVYPTLEKISIDYAVMEKACTIEAEQAGRSVMMVELKCDWLDVGSWPALENICELDQAGNVVLAGHAAVMDSFRNVIVTEDEHLLAVLGMDDCVIIHSADATLVCNKSDAQRLKELLGEIERKFGDNYS